MIPRINKEGKSICSFRLSVLSRGRLNNINKYEKKNIIETNKLVNKWWNYCVYVIENVRVYRCDRLVGLRIINFSELEELNVASWVHIFFTEGEAYLTWRKTVSDWKLGLNINKIGNVRVTQYSGAFV